jgi:cytochrome P450
MAIGLQQGMQEANEYFDVIRKDRLENPRDDIATTIAHARLDGDEEIPEKIINDMTLAVAIAGHHTTNHATSAGMHGMCVFPDQFEKVKGDPKLIPGLVDEATRWATPAKHFTRNATAGAEVGGQSIAEGDRLMILFASANRDANVFDRPDEFAVTRRPNRHLAFASGPHVCIGQNIAKLEMRVLWEELLSRVSAVELAGEPVYKMSNFVSGFKQLPIRFAKS